MVVSTYLEPGLLSLLTVHNKAYSLNLFGLAH